MYGVQGVSLLCTRRNETEKRPDNTNGRKMVGGSVGAASLSTGSGANRLRLTLAVLILKKAHSLLLRSR
jgi:hypothetical protein